MCRWGLFGDGDYDSWVKVNPTFVPVIYWTFQPLVAMLLVNALLAIIVDAYLAAKEEDTEPDAIWTSASLFSMRFSTYLYTKLSGTGALTAKVKPDCKPIVFSVVNAFEGKKVEQSFDLIGSVIFLELNYVPKSVARQQVGQVLRDYVLPKINNTSSPQEKPTEPPQEATQQEGPGPSLSMRDYLQKRLEEGKRAAEEAAALLAQLDKEEETAKVSIITAAPGAPARQGLVPLVPLL